jgi:hypothetical protein
MRRSCAALFSLSLLSVVVGVNAHAPSGAIFTTVEDGSEVNYNHYASKYDVYLDGGPGPGAPQHAAGLDDGRYVFQVTDPSGKRLLSEDIAACRQFDVVNGVIAAYVVVAGCDPANHDTGFDIDHGATTVQLMPYKDTPNNGGVYKAWAVRVDDFLAGCAAFGVANGLNVVDCGYRGGNAHGFVPSHSKTDNFKVKLSGGPREIDTRFFYDLDGNGQKGWYEEFVDGLQVTWTDTLGASNRKSSYFNPALDINHEAHVEAVEDGVHQIRIDNQPGCTVGLIHVTGVQSPQEGPRTISVNIPARMKEGTIFIDVACVVQ